MSHDTFHYNFPEFRLKDSFLSQRQRTELLYALQGRHELPLKYTYFENGVHYWDKKTKIGLESLILPLEEKPSKFNMFAVQYKMIQQQVEMVLASLKHSEKVNVVDVGCGNGWPVYPILSHLAENDQLGKYIAIDVVEEMTKMAVDNLSTREDLNGLDAISVVHDFEDGHFADKMYKYHDSSSVNLFCFFGNTLGTMTDRARALVNIRDSMTQNDLLWIGNSLYDNADSLAQFYNAMNTDDKNQLLEYHQNMLTLFESFGMDKWIDFGSIKVQHIDNKGMLDYFFEISKGFILNIPISGKDVWIEFHPQDRILYCKLKNYREGDLIEELQESGFRIRSLSISDDNKAALVLVSVKSA